MSLSGAHAPGVTVSTLADARSDVNSRGVQRSGKANPLWAIPLDDLRATRERPLFSVSRRLSSRLRPSSARRRRSRPRCRRNRR
jgi:hypothetical protein